MTSEIIHIEDADGRSASRVDDQQAHCFDESSGSRPITDEQFEAIRREAMDAITGDPSIAEGETYYEPLAEFTNQQGGNISRFVESTDSVAGVSYPVSDEFEVKCIAPMASLPNKNPTTGRA